MPTGGATHVRRVVGDDDAVVAVFVIDAQRLDHVHITIIDKGLGVIWHLTHHVAEVDIGDLALGAVGVNCFVDITGGHLGNRPLAKFKGIVIARHNVE